MPRPFFYRLNAADFFAVVRDMPNKVCAKWLKTFASDLVSGHSTDPFTISLIEEAKKFKEIKSLAGKRGMEKRYQSPNTVITELELCCNTDITNSSNSNNTNKRKKKEKPPIEIPEWLPRQTFEEFLVHRKQLKKPMTDTAIEKMFTYLNTIRNVYDPVKLLDLAMRNGWLSVVLKDECKHQKQEGPVF